MAFINSDVYKQLKKTIEQYEIFFGTPDADFFYDDFQLLVKLWNKYEVKEETEIKLEKPKKIT